MKNENQCLIFEGGHLIPLSRIAERPYVCPECLSSTITIEGYYRRKVRQVRREGNEPVDELAPSLDLDIQVIDCPLCETRFIVAEDVIFAQQQRIMELTEQVRLLQGTYQKGNSRIN